MDAANEGDELSLTRGKGIGILLMLVATIGWGVACGVLRTSYWPAALGGIGLSGFGFWLERATLLSPETVARKDFHLILACGIGFFIIVGIGVVSLSALLATWYLPRL